LGWKQPIDLQVYVWFGDDHLARDLFIHLLLRAKNKDMENPEHFKGKPFLLKRGQTIFGRNEYAEKLRCSPSGTRNALVRLEKVYSKVTSKSNTDFTVITILNYDDLVCMEQANKQAGDKQVTSKGQAKDTNKSVKSDKSDKNKDPVSKKPKRDSSPWKNSKEVMSRSQFVERMLESPQRHVQIIGHLADEMKPGLQTKGQWQVFFDRYKKEASVLVPFSDDQLTYGARKAIMNHPDIWTLETIKKEILKRKDGEK